MLNTVLLSDIAAASSGAENFVTGLGIAASGLIIVFAVLLIICGVLYLFGAFFAAKPKKAAEPAPAPAAPAPVVEEEPAADETELVAVITAAVAAYLGQNSDGFVVKSFKRVQRTGRR